MMIVLSPTHTHTSVPVITTTPWGCRYTSAGASRGGSAARGRCSLL